MKNSTIRFAEKKDISKIIDLCEAHAHFEESDYNRDGKGQLLERDIFDASPKIFCLVVENENELIGYATYAKQYSTWDANQYIYMDCLYMTDQARGYGIGEKLVRKIQEEGKKTDCDLVQWQTPDFNVRAIKFYYRIGATSKSKERFFLKI
ncbi:MAG: GNAT family N-acetyltransferase [Urechidicola sp.]